MMIPDTTRVFLGALAFHAVACSTPVAFFKLTAGESSLVLDATHLEHAIAGDDTVGNSYVRLTLSEKGVSNLASFTENHIGKDLEIFHGGKRVSGKMLLRDKLVAKELFVTVENKTEANKLAESIENRLQHRAKPD